jgi:hypothetical protein
MDAYAKRFMELLRYVPYLKDEKVRVQHFLSGFPQSYQDQIEFDKPKTLEDTIQKAKCCYDQSKHKKEPSKDWKEEEWIPEEGIQIISIQEFQERCIVGSTKKKCASTKFSISEWK